MPRLAGIKAAILVVIQERGGVYHAHCPFLNVSTHADTRDEAFRNLQAEIRFLFKSALEDGSIVDLLDCRTSQRREPSSSGEFVQLEITSTEVDLPSDIPEHLLQRFADAPEFPA